MSMRYPTFGPEEHLAKMPYRARCELIPIKFARLVMLPCTNRAAPTVRSLAPLAGRGEGKLKSS